MRSGDAHSSDESPFLEFIAYWDSLEIGSLVGTRQTPELLFDL